MEFMLIRISFSNTYTEYRCKFVLVNMDTIDLNKLMSWLHDLWSRYCPSKWVTASIVAVYAYYR